MRPDAYINRREILVEQNQIRGRRDEEPASADEAIDDLLKNRNLGKYMAEFGGKRGLVLGDFFAKPDDESTLQVMYGVIHHEGKLQRFTFERYIGYLMPPEVHYGRRLNEHLKYGSVRNFPDGELIYQNLTDKVVQRTSECLVDLNEQKNHRLRKLTL